MDNTFLPEGYVEPANGGAYMKFSQGANRFRVLSSAITGFEYWTKDNKPVRSKNEFTETPNIKTNNEGKSRVNHFWAFVVWDYKGSAVKILEITQAQIRNGIMALVKNPEWGDPKGYDITVDRQGQDIETTYTVSPSPHRPIAQEIQLAYDSMNIDLNELYKNGDPFKKSSPELNTPAMQAQASPLDEAQF